MNRRGFTLLELIIAIAVFGMVAVMIASALGLGYRSVDKGERRIESLERRKFALMLIQSQIRSFVPIRYYDAEAGVNRYRFEGAGRTLSFPSNYSVWGGGGGTSVYVTYRVVDDGAGKVDIYLSERNLFATGMHEGIYGGGQEEEEVLLVEGADKAGFEYFDKGPLKPVGEWVVMWEDTKRIPGMIRVSIKRGLTDLVIPLRVRARGL